MPAMAMVRSIDLGSRAYSVSRRYAQLLSLCAPL
jgi:hypothetical protein